MWKQLHNWVKGILQSLFKAAGAYWGVLLLTVLLLAGVALILSFVLDLEWADWTGFGKYTEGQRTLWDWLELLIVPVVLALGALWFNKTEKANEQNIATDRQREAALQNYIDKMTDLLLHEKTPLRASAEESEVRVVARTRTLATLRALDPWRKRILLLFLYEAGLINKQQRIVKMRSADLHDAYLRDAILSGADLSGVNLSGAILSGAILSGANLSGANLGGADLGKTDLSGANLSGANLGRTRLSHADLSGSDLQRADLMSANLYHANLRDADLSGACLVSVDLRNADLSSADLRGAHLIDANLIRDQILSAKTLEGAIMRLGEQYDPAIHGHTKGSKPS